MQCTVINSVRRPGISRAYIERVVSSVCERVRAHGDVSVCLVGSARMRNLNNRARGIARPTDVLSFPAQEGEAVPAAAGGSELGDIVLCPEYIRAQAKRFGVQYRQEFTRSLIHATLHLAGFDHVSSAEAKNMFSIQEQILSTLV